MNQWASMSHHCFIFIFSIYSSLGSCLAKTLPWMYCSMQRELHFIDWCFDYLSAHGASWIVSKIAMASQAPLIDSQTAKREVQLFFFKDFLSIFPGRQLSCGQEDDDVSTVLKGVSSASLEALNFADYLNKKYAPRQKTSLGWPTSLTFKSCCHGSLNVPESLDGPSRDNLA